ncbi:MAG: hypothetical protein ACFFCP_18025, partial [Promethearchaeota archaeon]
ERQQPIETEQVTLNGSPLYSKRDEKATRSKRKSDEAVQSPLSDFMHSKEQSKKKTPKKKTSASRGRRKKK